MLGKSCDRLPYNIVFVLDDEGSPNEVIGHSRLCRVHGQEKSCFVESGTHSLSQDVYYGFRLVMRVRLYIYIIFCMP